MNAPTAELTRPKVDQYDFWRRRLAGEVIVIHDGEPQAGFYRNSGDAVAYWFAASDGSVRCKIGKELVSEHIAMERWPWASKRPVSHEAYKEKIETGNWPSESQVVTADMALERTLDPAVANTLASLDKRIVVLKAAADALVKAGEAPDEETSDAAADIANRLAYLWKKADEARVLEKAPYLAKEREVDDKWRPLLTAATFYKKVKEAVVTPYLKKVEAAKAAALAKAKAEAEAASLKAIAMQEEAARTAVQSNGPTELVQAKVEAATEAARAAIAKVEQVAAQPVTAGTRGRSMGLRGKIVVTITDREACLVFFKDRQEITDALQDMAERAIKAGIAVPGATSTKDSSAA